MPPIMESILQFIAGFIVYFIPQRDAAFVGGDYYIKIRNMSLYV